MARFLVVDDSLFSRKRMCRFLSKRGHESVEAQDGQQALVLLAEQSFDGMFLDLLMPKVDGLRVLEARQQKAFDTPVIVVSADIQDSTRARVEELGAEAFLNKTCKEGEFEVVLQQLLESQP